MTTRFKQRDGSILVVGAFTPPPEAKSVRLVYSEDDNAGRFPILSRVRLWVDGAELAGVTSVGTDTLALSDAPLPLGCSLFRVEWGDNIESEWMVTPATSVSVERVDDVELVK